MNEIDRELTPARPLEHVCDPAGWYSEEIIGFGGGDYRWTDDEIAEIDATVAAFEASGRDLLDVTRESFPLPLCARRLRRMNNEIKNGVGFVLARGLPVQRYSRRQAAIAFLGLGAHLGRAVSQNAQGHILGHVKDLGKRLDDPRHRAYHTNEELDFHSDSCDVVALLCLHHAKSGGLSRITSSITIYNEMLRRRPDLVRQLTQDLYRDRRGEVPKGKEPWWRGPVFGFRDGHLSVTGGKTYVYSAQRFPDVPRLSDAQREALEMFEALAVELQHFQEFQPGDVQILNNHVIIHSRTAYEDGSEPDRKRHLLRLWLEVDGLRPILDVFRERINGILVADAKPTVPLDAE